MAIPTYWGRESNIGWKEGDAIYDHPTHLDSEGTLLRVIQSAEILNDKQFQLIIIAVAIAEDIEAEVERKVTKIIKSASTDVEVLLFGPSHLKKIHDTLVSDNKEEYISLLNLRGYSNIRNLCMFIPHVLHSEIAILIDDDEVFEDPDYINKAKEFIGTDIDGKTVTAIAGYYLQSDGGFHVKKESRPWMNYWAKNDRMNEAFDKFIGTEPRIKETPFVFGGNMVIHEDLYKVVPFDPYVTRGEDIDFLINAMMFGFRFYLDNQLAIKHLPPPKSHFTWMRLREDIYRFVYEKVKIESQKETPGLTMVHPEEFDPYPGCFLKEDLLTKIEKSCELLSEEYLENGDRDSSEETLRLINVAKERAIPKYDPFQRLCETQARWKGLMEYVDRGEVRSRIQKIVLGK